MPVTRWNEVKRILGLVVDETDPSREAILVANCGCDAALRAEVDSFLRYECASASDEQTSLFQEENLLAPVSLGCYRIEQEIGRGGMGTVYRARGSDHLHDRHVAIKVLDSVFQPAELVRRFEAERRILARLNHPAIARLLDAGLTPHGKPYYVLEFVAGQNLTDYLETHLLTEHKKLKLFLQVLKAVSYAHQQFIIHLDLKPGNIMVSGQGCAKLLDFGLAKVLDPHAGTCGQFTRAPLRMMTPAYASPEQIDGQPLTVASDIYSLGVVLYEMLSARKPISVDGLSSQALLTAVLNTPVTPPIRVPGRNRDLNEIVLRTLAKHPSDRYRSVEHLFGDLRRYLDSRPVTAHPAPIWRRPGLSFAR